MSSDYTRIATALEFIAGQIDTQPSLERIAAEVDLSPHHLQRLFTRWVGVSPKKFLQYLTLDRAKAALDAHRSVLDAAMDAGLSGPGRLHDLFVSHEAVTPGEYKGRGEGLTIEHGWSESPFGDALLFLSPRGLCGLAFAFAGARGRAEAFADMKSRWPRARLVENPKRVGSAAAGIFGQSSRRNDELRLVL